MKVYVLMREGGNGKDPIGVPVGVYPHKKKLVEDALKLRYEANCWYEELDLQLWEPTKETK